MTLAFAWEWESAPNVAAPELRATWSTLQIDVGDVTATLVDEPGHRSGLRRRINVPTYPLAEWVAYNWWRIISPTARGSCGFRLAGAGDGFVWPDLTLTSGPGYVLAHLQKSARRDAPIRFLSSGEILLSPHQTQFELRRFVDATVQQLTEAGVAGTPLQDEWSAINTSDEDVASFCRTAAALDIDPYDITGRQTELVLAMGEGIRDSALLAEVAAATGEELAPSALEWLNAALSQISSASPAPHVAIPFLPLPFDNWSPPWLEGYGRARRFRSLLEMSPETRLDVQDLVEVAEVPTAAPVGFSGLARGTGDETTVAVGSHTSRNAQRFVAARAIGRRTFDESTGPLLLTWRDEYVAKVERAFAAELLAPAEGLAKFLKDASADGSLSDESVGAAARKYGVDLRVVQHQVENQLKFGDEF